MSIIDLSTASDQPFAIDHLVMVYNGEVYNYLVFKEELILLGYTFYPKRYRGDLKAYQAWGSDCVNHFVGMWAFAIYNTETNILFCSRDRFGIKPFYYIHHGGQFYFASEVSLL